MFSFLRKNMTDTVDRTYQTPKSNPELNVRLAPNLQDALVKVRQLCGNTADLQIRPLRISGIETALIMCEGMVSLDTMSQSVLLPLNNLTLEEATPEKLLNWMNFDAVLAAEQKMLTTYRELFDLIMSGFVVILIDGLESGIALGIQGFSSRSISDPSLETNVRGSREGFVESLRVNMSMVRRRMKTPDLRMELMKVGEKSNTDICLVYRSDMVSDQLLQQVHHRLSKIELDVVMESGYLQPFLEGRRLSFFSTVGTTERPDTLCSKISEGRIAVMVDGTPFALVVPYLFTENFQSIDDYSQSTYYAAFIRLLKYTAFFIGLLLPGLYVAIATFHPELFPDSLLFNVTSSEEGTPFTLMLEAIMIHFLYEIMREAGLRLPREVGHAVSIVGALVIGDAAVTAGLIGTPMVMVVAVTAISAFVVPSLYEPVTVLRLIFIVLGGTMGLFGIVIGLALMGINLCAMDSMGVPIMAPNSPFSLYSLRDILVRWNWKELGEEELMISNLPGSNENIKKKERD